MRILILATGPTQEKYLQTGMDHYLKRLKNYQPKVEYKEIKIPSKVYSYKDINEIKKAEADTLLTHIDDADYLTILDERGKTYTSTAFANYISSILIRGYKRWVFLIGGPFGFDEAIYLRANHQIALSKMTFTHQMIRLLLLEQIYRAQTILQNQSYHH
ncbi:MAG: 23S rRNA (pseudouridine(1915)-N(3))-methyltransferase RlmH [Saprospirales bacterium]|nr:MAG: 23S rRNA (pseudouridine(1915)-N(3))-methyltransferase RlmH [Saprospirales bacterium]